jgi:hypothetical protein
MHISFEIYLKLCPKWEIILQRKKVSFVRNYFAEQERSLMGNYLAGQEGFLNKKLSCRAREV